MDFKGYRSIRALRDSGRTRSFAAIREADQRAVLIKVHEALGADVRIEHEFRLLRELEVEGLVTPLALERSGRQLAVVSPWSAGVSLAEYVRGRPISVADFVEVAVQIVRVLVELHRCKVIHRNLKPRNLFISPDTRQVCVAEPGISVLLERERHQINNPWVIEHSLPYVSPAQTGRTHHEVEFRSDLYALGITFYELLTGRRPFDASSALELIHAHLARRPQTPQRIRPELPTSLSAITMKLIEKAPERRYQSAHGLLSDLERLASALASGAPLERFSLALSDVPTVLQLPHRLYGRSREVAQLTALYRRAGHGRAQLVFVSGATGLGKTALVNQLAEPVISRRGHFARGTCERDQIDKPYASMFGAFAQLANQLLTLSDEALASWRARLREQLGAGAAVLAELVPNLRPVIGPVPTAPALGPLESRNRLAVACAGFVTAFAQAEHPLLLSLDDMQWADAATCELIAALLVEPDAALLIIATVRPEDLAAGAPLEALMAALAERGDPRETIELSPLTTEEVTALIADTLAWPREHVSSLAEIVGRNTDHNPMFIGQYLTHLFDFGLLRPSANGWEWDTEAIRAAGIPEDLVGMMAAKLDLLSPVQRELLSAAAVIGRRFEIATLADIVPAETLDAGLVTLLREGLLTTLPRSRCGFTHDRIRKAAYAMLSTPRCVELHGLVGESCLQRSGFDEMDESFADLVDHLDIGCGLFPIHDEPPARSRARAREMLAAMSPERRSMLAEFNALAGHNALAGAAPRAASRYFEAGVRLLGEPDAEPGPDGPSPPRAFDHELHFSLELGRCMALGLAGEREAAERYFERLLDASLDVAQIGRTVASRVECRIGDDDRRGAIACGLEGLARLGVEALDPGHAPTERLIEMLHSHELRALGPSGSGHAAWPEAALEILTALIPVSHLIDSVLHVALVTAHISIMLAHGRSRGAPIALAYAAMHVGASVDQRALALEVAERARSLASAEAPGVDRQHIEAPYWVVASWVRPYAEGLAPLRKSVELALATGDLEAAVYATDMGVTMALSAGEPLPALARAADEATRRLRQWQAGPLVARAQAYARFCHQLGSRDGSDAGTSLVAESELDGADHQPSQYVIRSLRGLGSCLLGDWHAALAELDGMDDFQTVVSGAWQVCDHALVVGLAAAGLSSDPGPKLDGERREGLLAITRRSLAQLDAAAALSPINCTPRAALLDAELHAAEGRAVPALSAYARAQLEARASRVPWLEALAFERAADLLRALGLDALAIGSLRDARGRYASWGALAKVAQLDRRYPELIDESAPVGPRPSRPESGPNSPDGGPSRALDFATVLKASQTIAADIQLGEVVDRVLAIALENAGAERGALLIDGHGGLELVATCDADGRHDDTAALGGPLALDQAGAHAPITLLRWVERTREPAVLDDAITDPRFASDRYIAKQRVRSALCVPIIKHDHLVGLLYLENKLSPGGFTSDRLEVLDLLMAQAASALENAQLFEALRGSEVRWRSLVEGLPDAIMLVDPSGQVEFVNNFEASESSGPRVDGDDDASVAQTTSVRFDDLVHPDDADALHEQLGRAMREVSQTEVELRASFRSSAMRWYSLRLAPVAVDGRVARVIAVGTDITERHQAAEARQLIEAQVRQQQRLESIGTLASGVAHEINNPIQGIMNYAELIGTLDDVDETAREFCDEIRHEAQRVAAIVRGLRSFARTEVDAAMAPVDIRVVVQSTLLLVRTIMGQDQIQLDVELPEEPIEVFCREQQIRQIVMNLITNARDALCKRFPKYDEDKRIEVKVERYGPELADADDDDDPRDSHDPHDPHDPHVRGVRVSVSDRGGGVEPEVVARIFDPFFTTRGRDKGTGLGLSVSHGIAKEHGGEIRLDNTPGVGACFRLELPLDCRPRGS